MNPPDLCPLCNEPRVGVQEGRAMYRCGSRLVHVNDPATGDCWMIDVWCPDASAVDPSTECPGCREALTVSPSGLSFFYECGASATVQPDGQYRWVIPCKSGSNPSDLPAEAYDPNDLRDIGGTGTEPR